VHGKSLKKTKKKEAEFITFSFVGKDPDTNINYIIFYAIDVIKYKNYLKNHS
jgi:hypothetical protein